LLVCGNKKQGKTKGSYEGKEKGKIGQKYREGGVAENRVPQKRCSKITLWGGEKTRRLHGFPSGKGSRWDISVRGHHMGGDQSPTAGARNGGRKRNKRRRSKSKDTPPPSTRSRQLNWICQDTKLKKGVSKLVKVKGAQHAKPPKSNLQ